jgi:hypothetical protein
MAERLVGLAAVGGAPAPGELPVPLQLPYAADPGTLTGWLVTRNEGLDRDSILAVLASMNAKYTNVTDPQLTQDNVTSLLKELAEDVVASEVLESFLTIMTSTEAGKAMVTTVSRLSRFRSGIGQVSRFDGNVYGFFGEVEEGQLPPLMKLPDNMSLRQALAVRKCWAPSWAEFDAWYGDGPTNPRVPVPGDELMARAGEEAPAGVGLDQGEAIEGEEDEGMVEVPSLQYIPAAWAPYFMAAQTPEAAMRTWRKLVAGNLTNRHAEITESVTKWLSAACVRVSSVGANRTRSKMHMSWVSPLGAFERDLTRWASRRLSPFLTVAPVVQPTMVAGMLPPMAGGGNPTAGVMPPGMPPTGAAAMMPYETKETKLYSPLEHERIRMACGLEPANYEAGRPPIYAMLLAEGRSMVKVEAVLQKLMAPALDDWDPVRVYVSQELVRDMKDLKFGWGNENTYDTCHRGISPFAVLQVSMEQQTKRRKTQERADRATFLSTDDVRSLEAEPGCCPPNYYGMMSLLKRYIRLLTVLFGARCSHLLEVQGVYQALAEKVGVYELMSSELVAETIWQVFLDARECFSYMGLGLPESTLFALRCEVRSCSLKGTINCPVALLLNIPSTMLATPSAVSQSGSSGRTSGTGRMSGGSMAPSTMSTLTSYTEARRTREVPVIGGKRTNPDAVPELVEIMRDLRTKRPGVDMNALIRSERLVIADIAIGGRGACLDFMYLGECARAGCTFGHDPSNVSAGKRRDVTRKLTKAVAGYLEHNPSA